MSANNKYCPLDAKWLSPNIGYQGKITSTQPNYNDKFYFGKISTKVVQSFYNHTKFFSHEEYANDTELSKEHREIKRKNFQK